MPLSRSWVEKEVGELAGEDYDTARLLLVVAKASYQVDVSLVEAVLGKNQDEKRLIRILAFASLSAARRLASHVASHLNVSQHVSADLAQSD